MLNPDTKLLILILELGKKSIEEETWYPAEMFGVDREQLENHVQWLMHRNYLKPYEPEVDFWEYQTNPAVFEFHQHHYIISPTTEKGLEYLVYLRKTPLHRFLEGSPKSVYWILIQRTAELIGYITVFVNAAKIVARIIH